MVSLRISRNLRCSSDIRVLLIQLSVLGLTSCVFAYLYVSPIYKIDIRFSGNDRYLRDDINIPHFSMKSGVTSDEDFAKKIRILCLILTHPTHHERLAIHVKNTWGKRCNKLIFVSTANDTKLGAIDVRVPEGNGYLWGKTKAAFQHVYRYHLQEFDWFFKADDDTYAIMENMRYMLTSYNPEEPLYFGSLLKSYENSRFMSGGAGYILSRTATRKFVEEAMPNATLCSQRNFGKEDVEIGKCLANVGVLEVNSTDSEGRGRFFPLNLRSHLMGKLPQWYKDLSVDKFSGLGCCSDTAITFHFISPDQMYEFEYLLYHLRPLGIKKASLPPTPIPPTTNSTHSVVQPSPATKGKKRPAK